MVLLGVRADGSFRILEGEPIQVFISSMVPKEEPAAPVEEAAEAPAGGEDVVMGE
jgi:20S proteasome subunit alpha 6